MALTAAGEQEAFVIFDACTSKDSVRRLSPVANAVAVGWNSDLDV